jgi:hypothetical protein
MKLAGALTLAGACCVLLTGAAAAKSTSPQVMRTAGVVEGLAADAGLVAMIVGESKGDCKRIIVWEPSRRSLVRVGSRKRPCAGLSTGESIPYAALAGRRVAWVWDGGGNFHDVVVKTATVGRPLRSTTLVTRNYDAGSGAGEHAGSLHGDGDLLVYGTWEICEGAEENYPSHPCPPGIRAFSPHESDVRRVRGTRSARIASDEGELGVLSASGGRVAVLRSDASVAVLTATGTLVKTFPFSRGELRGATLDGRRLVVLRRSAGRHTIDANDVLTGTRVSRRIAPPGPASDRRCWPVLSQPLCRVPYARLRLADSESGIAVYVVGREIHLLRMADGAETVVRPPAGRGSVEAQLERSGLFYTYRVADATLPGRVAFIPYGEVVGRLR